MSPPQGNLLSLWFRFLRQYLREPATRVLQPEVEKALSDLALPTAIKASPLSSADLALSNAAKSAASAVSASRRAPAELSVDSSLLPSGPALTTRAAAAVATIEAIAAAKRRKEPRVQATPGPARSRAMGPSMSSSSSAQAHHMSEGGSSGSSSSGRSGASSSSLSQGRSAPGSSSGGARKVDVSTGPSQPSSSSSTSTRFKRCYYVPVLNPLPDLKDKQLAVLDVRLYGIRDMPTFKERPPVLPQSVLTTAKLRGLDLYDINTMMRALEPRNASSAEESAEEEA